jgi:hypothetical protein
MKAVVFIHENAEQLLAEKRWTYSLKARFALGKFEVKLLELEKHRIYSCSVKCPSHAAGFGFLCSWRDQ